MRDRGHAAVELALAAGVLLLPAAIAVLSFGPWAEARVEAEAMAAEAARAAVISLDLDSGAMSLSEHADHLGLEASDVRLGWCGAPPINGSTGTCPLSRGSVVVATVEVWTPLISTPWGAVGGLWVSADHVEPIDLYRSLG